MPQELVYGALADGLVLIPRETAERLTAAFHATHTATTWGEFKRLLPAETRAELEAGYREDENELPADDEPFNADEVPG